MKSGYDQQFEIHQQGIEYLFENTHSSLAQEKEKY